MRITWSLFTFGALVAAEYSTVPSTYPTRDRQACGKIGAAAEAFLARNPNATAAQVPAQIAYDCLQTVPNKPEPALELIRSLKAFVQWQSTLAWLKNPPSTYMLPATDIEGGLDNISSIVASGRYKSEYDFQLSVVKLIISAHDGHFSYIPDVFSAFQFQNNLAANIVSVSVDGKAVPKLYHIEAITESNGTIETVPAITQINGQDAVKYITESNLQFSQFQDPDSMWNSQFPSFANIRRGLVAAASPVFLGANFTLTYDNGQQKTQRGVAVLKAGVSFTGITCGEDFYERFCTPVVEVTASDEETTVPTNTTVPRNTTIPTPPPSIPGYPLPLVRDSGANLTSGYFLSGSGYENVAVLAISGFQPAGEFNSVEFRNNFQQTVETFLAKSKAAGKTKLVVDLQANGGGLVQLGFELFAQLFPDVQRFQANNLRLSEGLVDIAETVASLQASLLAGELNVTTPAQQEAVAFLQESVVLGNIVPGEVFTPNGTQFTNEQQILGPVVLNGDNFTAYQQTPLTEPNISFNLTGTGNRSNPPPSAFAAEDIVLLTDGTCGSTCTIFSYLMILQMNVKTTVVGGRPQTGSMQSIAGVEGSQVFPLNEISNAAAAVIELVSDEQKSELEAGEVGVLAEGYALQRLASPTNPGGINAKNAFSATDSKTPLQFLMQPANCRIFYTVEMLRNPETLWKRTVDATWTDPNEFCVEGSIVAVSSTSLDNVAPVFKSAVDGSNAGI